MTESTHAKLMMINNGEVFKFFNFFQVGNPKVLDNESSVIDVLKSGFHLCCTWEGEWRLLGLQTQGQGG